LKNLTFIIIKILFLLLNFLLYMFNSH